MQDDYMEMVYELKKLRELLWLHHGCDASLLYSVNGSMMCGACKIDFASVSAKAIERAWMERGYKIMERAVCDAGHQNTEGQDKDTTE